MKIFAAVFCGAVLFQAQAMAAGDRIRCNDHSQAGTYRCYDRHHRQVGTAEVKPDGRIELKDRNHRPSGTVRHSSPRGEAGIYGADDRYEGSVRKSRSTSGGYEVDSRSRGRHQIRSDGRGGIEIRGRDPERLFRRDR